MSALIEEPIARELELAAEPSPVELSRSDAATLPAMGHRRVLGLAVPIIGENLLHTTVVAADTFMVSRLGTDQVAGVGTAAELVWFLTAMLVALDIGATVLVAQSIGAGRIEAANRLARQAIVWGLLIAFPVSLLGYLGSGPVISLFGTEAAVARNATTYLHITTAMSVFLLLTFVCSAVLRGAGDSRSPLYAAIVANIVNVVVSYGLIFGHAGLPRLGVAGSAWGAASARAVAAMVLLGLLVSGRRKVSVRGRDGWRPELSTGRAIFRLGIPAAIQEMLTSAGFMTMLAVVAMLGTAALAAQQIGFTVLSLAFMPGFAFGIASTALVGQSIGAGRPAEATRAVAISVRWSVGWMLIGGVICMALAHPLMDAFTNDPEVTGNGVHALRALGLGLPFWSIWFVFGGGLRGVGDTRTPMLASAVGVWGAVALAYLVVTRFDGGLGSVWLTFLATAPVAAFINLIWFRRTMKRGVKQLTPSDGPLPVH